MHSLIRIPDTQVRFLICCFLSHSLTGSCSNPRIKYHHNPFFPQSAFACVFRRRWQRKTHAQQVFSCLLLILGTYSVTNQKKWLHSDFVTIFLSLWIGITSLIQLFRKANGKSLWDINMKITINMAGFHWNHFKMSCFSVLNAPNIVMRHSTLSADWNNDTRTTRAAAPSVDFDKKINHSSAI